jgi:hypothetical protein
MRIIISLFIISFALVPIKTKEMCITYSPPSVDLYAGLNEYKRILSSKESGDNHLAVGRKYYRGLYQIGRSTSKQVNVPYDSLFKPRWSDTALVRLMRVNWSYLKGYENYIGKTVRGVKVTKAGLLSGSHLRGHIYVKIWLKTNGEIDGTDANGVPVSRYIKMMENVNLNKY